MLLISNDFSFLFLIFIDYIILLKLTWLNEQLFSCAVLTTQYKDFFVRFLNQFFVQDICTYKCHTTLSRFFLFKYIFSETFFFSFFDGNLKYRKKQSLWSDVIICVNANYFQNERTVIKIVNSLTPK